MAFTVKGLGEGSRLERELQDFTMAPAIARQFLNPHVAVFTTTDVAADEVRFYFTPDAVPVFLGYLDRYKARACAAPTKGPDYDRAMSLSQGDVRAWGLVKERSE
jgi:hypothetical protein